MRIEVNVAAGEPTATLTGADDFKSLSVVALPPGAQLMAGEATPDGAIRVATADQAWVDIAWLRAAAGVKEGDPGEADFDAMLEYAAGHGWVDQEGSSVAAHIEHQEGQGR